MHEVSRMGKIMQFLVKFFLQNVEQHGNHVKHMFAILFIGGTLLNLLWGLIVNVSIKFVH
jgi:hypothetical protein